MNQLFTSQDLFHQRPPSPLEFRIVTEISDTSRC